METNQNQVMSQILQFASTSKLTISNLIQKQNQAINTMQIYSSHYAKLNNFLIESNINAYDGGSLMIVYSNNINIDNSQLLDNKALMGAGIYLIGSFYTEISKTIFVKNDAQTLYQGQGGGIFAYGSSYSVIQNCQFLNNLGGFIGAGVGVIQGNSTLIENSIFMDNIAIAGPGYYQTESFGSILNNITGINNHGSLAAGFVASGHSDDTLIKNSYFKNNTAGQYGGFIATSYEKKFKIQNCTLEGSFSNFQGGAIFVSYMEDFYIFDTKFIGNSIIDGKGSDIQASFSKKLYVENCQFQQFDALMSGSVFSMFMDYLIIINSNFISSQNSDTLYTLEIINNLYTDINNTTFSNNDQMQEQFNGALKISYCMDFIIENSIIQNHKVKYNGASIHVTQTKNLYILNSQIKDSQSLLAGGCLFSQNTQNIQINNSTFDQCTTQTNGGGLFIQNSQNLTIQENTLIQQNQATHKLNQGKGGGIYIEDVEELNIFNSFFNQNQAYLYGGGLYIQNIQLYKLIGSQFDNNGVNFNDSKYFQKTVDNYIITQGGGIFYMVNKQLDQKGKIQIEDCIFNNNFAATGGAITFLQQPGSEIRVMGFENLQFKRNIADTAPSIRYLGQQNKVMQTYISNYQKDDETDIINKNIGLIIQDKNSIWDFQQNERRLGQFTNQIQLCPHTTQLKIGGEQQCQLCQPNELCQGGYFQSTNKQYYWKNLMEEDKYYFCTYNPKVCLEGEKCKEGYQGIMCQQCDLQNNFYKDIYKNCLKCPQQIESILYICLILLASILMITIINIKNTQNINTKILERSITHLWNLKVKKQQNIGIYLKIIITHFQVIYCLDTKITYNYGVFQYIANLICNPGQFIAQYSICFIPQMANLEDQLKSKSFLNINNELQSNREKNLSSASNKMFISIADAQEIIEQEKEVQTIRDRYQKSVKLQDKRVNFKVQMNNVIKQSSQKNFGTFSIDLQKMNKKKLIDQQNDLMSNKSINLQNQCVRQQGLSVLTLNTPICSPNQRLYDQNTDIPEMVQNQTPVLNCYAEINNNKEYQL